MRADVQHRAERWLAAAGPQSAPELRARLAQRSDGHVEPFLSYVEEDHAVNWSDELEELHEESSRTHFIDVWTRGAMLSQTWRAPTHPLIADLGCSTGYLLEDLRAAYPQRNSGRRGFRWLRSAQGSRMCPMRAWCRPISVHLPLGEPSVDAVVSANVLEHVPDDRARSPRYVASCVRAPPALLVVPAGPRIYDYYDRFLGHERRYAPGELALKARTRAWRSSKTSIWGA